MASGRARRPSNASIRRLPPRRRRVLLRGGALTTRSHHHRHHSFWTTHRVKQSHRRRRRHRRVVERRDVAMMATLCAAEARGRCRCVGWLEKNGSLGEREIGAMLTRHFERRAERFHQRRTRHYDYGRIARRGETRPWSGA